MKIFKLKYLTFLIIILVTLFACELELEHANPLDGLVITTGDSDPGTSYCVVTGTIKTNEFNGVDNYGHCWSTNSTPTINHDFSSNGSAPAKVERSFESNISDLDVDELYYVRAYVEANDTIVYGDIKSFETSWAGDVPLVETKAVTSITTSSAIISGDIEEEGEDPVTQHGHCWSTSQGVTIADNKSLLGSANQGDFTTSLESLNSNTTYYYRAYAENDQGLAYGSEKSFSTTNGQGSVITGGYDNPSTTSVTLEAEIIGEGNADITEHGHCWSTSSGPTINDDATTLGSGDLGEFTSNVSNLSANALYYYRAYVTNSYGTAYGEEQQFTTSDGSPIVKTLLAIFDGFSGSYCNYMFYGEIISYGSAPITSMGVAYSTWDDLPEYGISITPVQDGVFSKLSWSFSDNTVYYYRAYAENAFGRSYGEVYSFRTPEYCYISNSSTSGAPTITTSLNSSNTQVTVNISGGTQSVDNVYFYRNNTFIQNLGNNVSFTNGQKTFNLPSGLEVSDCYTIQISDGGNGSILMVSDPFTIE